MNEKTLLLEANTSLRSYLTTGIRGYFRKAWDRIRATGVDVDLRREPNVNNANALVWLVKARLDRLA